MSPSISQAACSGVGGRVVDAETGEAVSRAQVSLLDRVEKTNTRGEFCFTRVPRRRTVEFGLSVKNRRGEVISCEVFEQKVSFLAVAATEDDRVAVAVVDPGEETSVELRLQPVDTDDVDSFCIQCHRWNPCLENDTFTEIVENRKYLRGIIVSAEDLDRYKDEFRSRSLSKGTYAVLRYTDTHAVTRPLRDVADSREPEYEGRYRTPANLTLTRDGRTTCDTCHTRHQATEHGAFAVLPFREDDALCRECHR